MQGLPVKTEICLDNIYGNKFISHIPHPIEKVGNFPYPYQINTRIARQNGDMFGQYPRKQIYLSSLLKTYTNP